MKRMITTAAIAAVAVAVSLAAPWQDVSEYVTVDLQAMTNSLPAGQWQSLFTSRKVVEERIEDCRTSHDAQLILLEFQKNSTAATSWFDSKSVPYTKYTHDAILPVLAGTNWMESIDP